MRDLNFDIKARDQSQPAFDSARRNARGLNSDLDQTRVVMNAAGAAARAFAAAFALTSVAGFAATIRSTVAEGRDTVMGLITAPTLQAGAYYRDGEVATPHEQAADADAQRRLVALSAVLTGVALDRTHGR